MSTSDATYGQMLEQTREENDQEFWIEEVLREAGNVYGRRNGVDAQIADAESVSSEYQGYVLENAALGQKIIGFEVAPLLSEDHGTGFALRPEERNEEYEEFKESIFEAFYRDI